MAFRDYLVEEALVAEKLRAARAHGYLCAVRMRALLVPVPGHFAATWMIKIILIYVFHTIDF